jgi:hypothetical protein
MAKRSGDGSRESLAAMKAKSLFREMAEANAAAVKVEEVEASASSPPPSPPPPPPPPPRSCSSGPAAEERAEKVVGPWVVACA